MLPQPATPCWLRVVTVAAGLIGVLGCSDRATTESPRLRASLLEMPAAGADLQAADPKPAAPTAEQAEAWHEMGIRLYETALTGDDLDSMDQAIDLLEQAVAAAPHNRGWWIDLADAYFNAGNTLLVAEGLKICEELYHDDENREALLSRMADGYLQLDNRPAAMAMLLKRLEISAPQTAVASGLQVTLQAAADARAAEAARALQAKAKTLADDRDAGTLLLLGASLLELASDAPNARQLLDEAARRLAKHPELLEQTQTIRRRLQP
jgi:tetratricopeptide (TPR) repeat protein